DGRERPHRDGDLHLGAAPPRPRRPPPPREPGGHRAADRPPRGAGRRGGADGRTAPPAGVSGVWTGPAKGAKKMDGNAAPRYIDGVRSRTNKERVRWPR